MFAHKIYGVLGYPVKHSLSPVMHNAAFAALHINAKYQLFEKRPDELIGFLRLLAKENISGLNVTIPHKETVKNYLDTVTEEANLIGAVNTIRIDNGKTIGHNTDGLGFLKHLVEVYHRSLFAQTVAIIGAGGAARAVAYMLAAEGVSRICIFDIDKRKADSLAAGIQERFSDFEVVTVDSSDGLFEATPDLLVNASPVGMQAADSLPIPEARLTSRTFVYDVIYNPLETKLLKLAKSKGCLCSNGLSMLLYQGALSFEFWTGQNAPLELMRQALLRHMTL